jgi:hypothetical protein
MMKMPTPHEWTLGEMLKAGWNLRVKWFEKKKKFLAWFWSGPMEEVPVHKVYGLYCDNPDQAIRIAIREFEKEMV